jgi:hypothetical protein
MGIRILNLGTSIAGFMYDKKIQDKTKEALQKC